MNPTDRLTVIDRLLTTYESATPEQRGQGRWYFAMHDFAVGLADRYGVDVQTAADVIAVISPRLSVEKNMAYAELLFATGDAPIMSTPKRQARAIIAGSTIRAEVKNGPKIVSFADNIARPATSTAVTIDRHIYDWLTGSNDDDGRKGLNLKGAYEAAADLFRAAALILGLRPHELQAIVWFVQKEGKTYAQPQHATLYSKSGRL